MEMDVYHGHMEKKVIIREFDGERDLERIEKLERDLEIGSRRGFSIFSNMMGDPLCRVRLYPNHIMLVGVVSFVFLPSLLFSPYQIVHLLKQCLFMFFTVLFSRTSFPRLRVYAFRRKKKLCILAGRKCTH